MFINQLDKFIELQFNYTNEYIRKNKYNNNLTYYQKLLNKIEYSKLFENINSDSNKKKIQQIVDKYVLFYAILRINFNHTIKDNNIIFECEYSDLTKMFYEIMIHLKNTRYIGECE